MPDWTYQPLRRPMGILLGERRSLQAALAAVSWLVRIPGGRAVVVGLGHTTPPASARRSVAGADCAAPVGASVGPAAVADAVRALPPLGAGLIEVGPVALSQVEAVRVALAARDGPVALRVSGEEARAVASALAGQVSLVVVDVGPDGDRALLEVREAMAGAVLAGVQARDAARLPGDVGLVLREGQAADVRRLAGLHPAVIVTTSDPSIEAAADLVAAGAQAVLATSAGLIAAGPGWFHRATGAILSRDAGRQPDPPVPRLPWLAGVGLGLGMIAGGVGAAAVALGPVLLPYDVGFLGRDAAGLEHLNPQLVHFLQHDRVSLTGAMVAIGILYAGLSWFGIRRGRTWARDALLASGLVGFPTLFYIFAFGYVEPLHVALALVLFPLYLLAVWRRPPPQLENPEGDERPAERRRALVGQLLMVVLGAGLFVGGATISVVGLTTVYVPSDLAFLGTSAHALAAADDRLLGFVAHDRAGFGGALIAAGVAVALLAAWGWQRGQAWVWWSLASGAAAGFGATVAIHLSVGYTDFGHLAPVYAGILLSVLSLGLSYQYLLDRRPAPAQPQPALSAG